MRAMAAVLTSFFAAFLFQACSAAGGATGQPVAAKLPVEQADEWLAGWTGAAQGSNRYAHESDGVPLYVRWAGDAQSGGQYSNLSDCSYFGSATLERSYGWTNAGLVSWLCGGSCPVGRPQAVHYHDAILNQDHFASITDVRQIARGDIIALKYDDTTTDTGHFMLVESAPTLLATGQYAVIVDDSAVGYHGSLDTRYLGPTCAADTDCANFTQAICNPATNRCTATGIGRGTFRLYTDANYQVIGYSWSTASSSVMYLNSDVPLRRHVAVGRYDGSAGH